MAWAFLRGRQIFKFGLLRKKDNKKNLKIRLVFNRMVRAFFPPYYSYTIPLYLISIDFWNFQFTLSNFQAFLWENFKGFDEGILGLKLND
jgi:hypothetical protein